MYGLITVAPYAGGREHLSVNLAFVASVSAIWLPTGNCRALLNRVGSPLTISRTFQSAHKLVKTNCLMEIIMATTDPIADMLTRIRNAGKAKMNSVDIPGSKIKTELAKVLKSEGYIRNYKFIKDTQQGILRVYLKYGDDQSHVILEIKRVSKPSRRVYMGSSEIPPVYNGLGVAIVSTSKGILTDKQARKENVGGEILCTLF
jgi:small subunit ribosomal protein S8